MRPRTARRGVPRPFREAVCLLSSLSLASCTYLQPIAARDVAEKGSPFGVEVVLHDGTRYHLDHPRVAGDSLAGFPQGCEGPACQRVQRGSVALSEVASVEARKVSSAPAVLLVAGLAVATVAVAVAATSSRTTPGPPPPPAPTGSGSDWKMGSCPHVYSWDGAAWTLDSDTYSVSYFSSQPRTAYDRLDHLAEVGGRYRLRLVNELPETEHTDLLRLQVVDHPAGTSVVPDASGALHTFRHPQPPLAAADLRGADALSEVSARDGREWRSDPSGRATEREGDARDGLELRFARPPGASTAKLRVAAHSTQWAAQMMGVLLASRTEGLPAWLARLDADDAARAGFLGALGREGMLRIQVRTASGWSTRGTFWSPGPEVVKEQAFTLPIADAAGDALEVRLETAVGFWTLDAVAIDYGPDEPVAVRELTPSTARAPDGHDLAAVLADADGRRYDTATGDVAEITFAAPPPARAGVERSLVLVSAGYYVPQVAPAKDADPEALDALLAVPGGASLLALDLLNAEARRAAGPQGPGSAP